MKVCIVTHYFTPHIGGIERISFEQAKRLSILGHEVTVISSRLKGDLAEESTMGVNIIRIPVINILYDYFGIPFPLPAPTLLNILRRKIQLADVCIIHSFGFLTSFVASFLSIKENIPYILYQHNPRITYRSQLFNLLQSINELIFGKYIIRNANRVLAVSNYVKEYLVSLVPCDVTILYGAVDHDKFHPNESYITIRRELALPLDKLVVLTVRRLVSKNSVDVLLAVVEQFQNDPEIFFVVAGDGPEYRRLNSKKVQKNCKFVGKISDDLLQKYYQAANLFILPSVAEGFGLVLLDAMASGKAVVVAKEGGQVEVVENEKNGLLVKNQSPYLFAQAIRRFRSTPTMLETMGICGREIILQKFSWEQHMQALMKIIRDTQIA